MSLWSGIMQIAKNTKLIDALSKILKPLIKLLFPEFKKNKKIQKEISTNTPEPTVYPLGLMGLLGLQENNIDATKANKSRYFFFIVLSFYCLTMRFVTDLPSLVMRTK